MKNEQLFPRKAGKYKLSYFAIINLFSVVCAL